MFLILALKVHCLGNPLQSQANWNGWSPYLGHRFEASGRREITKGFWKHSTFLATPLGLPLQCLWILCSHLRGWLGPRVSNWISLSLCWYIYNMEIMRTTYIICGIQHKMKMWSDLLKIIKNFKMATKELRVLLHGVSLQLHCPKLRMQPWRPMKHLSCRAVGIQWPKAPTALKVVPVHELWPGTPGLLSLSYNTHLTSYLDSNLNQVMFYKSLQFSRLSFFLL